MTKFFFFFSPKVPKRADLLEKTPMLGKIEGKRRRGWQGMRWLDSITDSIIMDLSKLRKTVEDWRAVVHGITESQTDLSTEQQQQQKCLNISLSNAYTHTMGWIKFKPDWTLS